MPGRLGALWLSLIGLAAGAWLGSGGGASKWQIALAMAFLAGSVAMLRRAPSAVLSALLIASLALGFAGAAARSSEGSDLERALQRTRGCSFQAHVLEHAGGLGTLVALDGATCSSGSLPPGNLFWEPKVSPPVGTLVRGWGLVTALGDDDFGRARREAGGRGLLLPTSIESEAPGGFWAGVALVRARFRSAARDRLAEREAALLMGLSIGDTSGFSAADLDAFRATGLAHLLAVSGSNVAIVLGAIAALTRRVAYARRLAITLAAAVAFVAIVGPDGSVLRAAVMGSLALLAGGWIRPVDPVHSLPFALIVLIAARPSMVTSAGLHLSAAATLGIVLWSRRLTERLELLPPPVAASLGVTIAAQIGVAPLLVLMFERLSVIAPLTNVLAAPGVAVATLAGMAAATLAPMAPEVASFVARLGSPALRWILVVADVGASSSWAEVVIPRWWGWILAPGVLAAIVGSLRARSPA